MKILYGTTNKAKLKAMEVAVKPLGIEIIGLNDLDRDLPYIIECGKTPLENAEIKARPYYEAFHMPVFHWIPCQKIFKLVNIIMIWK